LSSGLVELTNNLFSNKVNEIFEKSIQFKTIFPVKKDFENIYLSIA
jgi:hypothetical protein